MSTEIRTCQNCKTQFAIEPEDFNFYEKISVPPPTFCPECRMQRRFLWRNERTLYKRKCSLCERDIISLYHSQANFPVYCHECWFSDRWNPQEFGLQYSEKKPFMEQFGGLLQVVPRIAIYNTQSVNSEYTNQSYNNKNSYLSFALRDCEDSAYLCYAVGLKDCFDATYTHHSESLYEAVNTDKCSLSSFLLESEGCVESSFLTSCRNCQNCIGGVNLRLASHIFFGEKFTKEQFAEKRKAWDMGSFSELEKAKKRFHELKANSIFKFSKLTNCINCLGDHLSNSKNCHYVFDGFELENARHSAWVFSSKEISDTYGMGGSEFVYESIGVEGVNNLRFCSTCDASNHVAYSYLCFGSSNLFGCIGLRNKQYSILNKQYLKEEYEKLVPIIIEHMNDMPYIDAKGHVYKYGEFFPPELAPFAYNETIAQEYFPLTKDKAITQGFVWKEPEIKHYEITKKPSELADHIKKEIDDSILKEVIGCEHGGKCNEQCTTAFKIISQELQFYRKRNLPLPRLCPNCRHYQRLKQRNPLKLWNRQCMCDYKIFENSTKHQHHSEKRCPNEFKTSYAPERKEIVYCEQCYQAEVA